MADAAANLFPFEIERTDSLEFTRNSDSGSRASYEDGDNGETRRQHCSSKTVKENEVDLDCTEPNIDQKRLVMPANL